ncbi:putative proliferating cell nuclear antigen [Medusavirus stheno T3]|uniref:Proliferating cell nuclear antigen n=1 Tax=Medusavirus stheno T3 TaxID=3069717 RepID=A0A7S7YG04_9VIRU|nr:putative proliferating cell nuclear antigen [Acanthamoeba castellanii medusavirus]QPB44470.1 putative proliferating cell nuclear antigen [Medusavirus stheno T3]
MNTFTLGDSDSLFALFWNLNGVIADAFKIRFDADGVRVRETVTHADSSTSVVDLLMRAEGFDDYQIVAPFVVSFTWTSLTRIFPVNASYRRKLIVAYDDATQKLSFDFREPNDSLARQTVFTFDAPLVAPADDTGPMLPLTPAQWDSTVTLPAYSLTRFVRGLVWFGPTVDFATHVVDTSPSMTITSSATNGDACVQYALPQVDYAFAIAQECVSHVPTACIRAYAPDPAPIGMATVYLGPSVGLFRISYDIQSTKTDPQTGMQDTISFGVMNCYISAA